MLLVNFGLPEKNLFTSVIIVQSEHKKCKKYVKLIIKNCERIFDVE